MYKLDLGDVTREMYENNARFLQRALQAGLDRQQPWSQAVTSLSDDSEAPDTDEVGQFAEGVSWPAVMAWRQIRRQLSFMRGAIEITIANQTAQSAELQEAITDWQTERLRILTGGAKQLAGSTPKTDALGVPAALDNAGGAKAMTRSARP